MVERLWHTLDSLPPQQVKSACEGKLAPCEIPRRVALVPEPWTPDNTTVSSALKIRRNAVYAEHAGLIERMYESGHHK
jgi:long-subunit acyl-CoA synthetase (AMP-forming)